MNEILYCIEDERGNILAKDMSMDTAMVLLRALFGHYYNEDELTYTLKRQKENIEVENSAI